ncbi:hypothetical protein PY093_11890 [Cytobacillus sp. S13-E01]|uniref:hypothetical protein n=1 Tax=Cytobacillus sp. S13-E01 TaxID=3031326 RepID=UPI0023D87932|nr:hypothetical protein [Cytobacillus sp. S13-E01]MDF0727388.1 hypothetical protein [Cytobacillus sp. S13-E01]
MGIIATQKYTIVTRVIESNQQKYIEEEKYLYLYLDRIVSTSHHFLLSDVFDMSYKKISAVVGFLYLHTNQGVFSYTVKTNPKPFIYEYKSVK